MKVVKLIQDPLYLKRQKVTDVKEHQVPSLMVHIKSMVVLCRKNSLGSMCATEAGLPYNFFVAENPDPRDPDYDVVFQPTVIPVINDGQKMIEEQGVNGKTYKVRRWRKVRMSWLYHNGHSFEEKSGEFEGEVAYIAQRLSDRLGGLYVGPDTDHEVVTIQTQVQ